MIARFLSIFKRSHSAHPSWTLRRATSKDIKFCSQLYQRDCEQGHYLNMGAPPEQFFNEVIQRGGMRTLSNPEGFRVSTLIVELHGKPAGFIVVRDSEFSQDAAEIWFTSLHDDHQRKGGGTYAISATCRQLKDDGMKRVHGRTFSASAVMERILRNCGFKIIKTLRSQANPVRVWELEL